MDLIRFFVCLAIIVSAGNALAARKPHGNAKAIDAICSKVEQIGSKYFYKNNKPIRAGNYLTAPVIGQNPVMTIALQAGQRGFAGSSAKLYASDGTYITSLVAYPCRSDHCGGRYVSSMSTSSGRRAVVKASGSAAGYFKINRTTCVYVKDVGGCEGGGVDKGRPLCDRIVK